MIRFSQHKAWWRFKQIGDVAHNPGFYRVGGWDEDEIAIRESILRNGYIGGDSIGAVSDVSKWHNEMAGLTMLPRYAKGEPATKAERAEARWQRKQAQKQREKERIADAEWAAEAARRRVAEYNAAMDQWQQEFQENAVIRVLCGETTVFLK